MKHDFNRAFRFSEPAILASFDRDETYGAREFFSLLGTQLGMSSPSYMEKPGGGVDVGLSASGMSKIDKAITLTIAFEAGWSAGEKRCGMRRNSSGPVTQRGMPSLGGGSRRPLTIYTVPKQVFWKGGGRTVPAFIFATSEQSYGHMLKDLANALDTFLQDKKACSKVRLVEDSGRTLIVGVPTPEISEQMRVQGAGFHLLCSKIGSTQFFTTIATAMEVGYNVGHDEGARGIPRAGSVWK